MGALHAGHLSLIKAARRECERVVVSIFVNPTQFGPGEDFDAYPRDVERDLSLLAEHGVDWAFVPARDTIYRSKHATVVDVGNAAKPWEGAARPGHFQGVATIVLKLFHLSPADVAYFGQKDYQQTVVIRQMVADLDVPIEIRVCPTVREPDGLAMSSRNAYLSPDERLRASAVWQSLQLAKSLLADGERNAATIRELMLAHLGAVNGLEVEYVAIMADSAVREVAQIDGPTVVAVAVRVGRTRLIDNLRLGDDRPAAR